MFPITVAVFKQIHSLHLMRTSVWKALRVASCHSRLHPCRFIAGRRFSLPQHTFHTSSSSRREDDPANTAWSQFAEQPLNGNEQREVPLEVEQTIEDPNGASDKPPKPKDKSNYGSASRRQGRNLKRTKEELPPVHVPPWLLDRNVVLREDRAHLRKGINNLESAPPEHFAADGAAPLASHNEAEAESGQPHREESEQSQQEISGESSIQSSPQALKLDMVNMREIFSVISAGLQVPSSQRAEIAASPKPHVVLFCPKDGGSWFLEVLGLHLAIENRADYLRLSPQDIAEIGGDYMDEPSNFRGNTLSSLGYDAPLVTAMRHPQQEMDEASDEDGYDEAEEDDIEHVRGNPKPFTQSVPGASFNAVHIGAFAMNVQDLFKPLSGMLANGSPQQPKVINMRNAPQPKDMTPELKMSLLVETLLNAPQIKREAGQHNESAKASSQVVKTASEGIVDANPSASEASQIIPPNDAERGPEALIVLIQDYPQINSTVNGGKFLDKLHEAVDARRREGQRVLIVGTASSKELMPSFSRSGVNEVQRDPRPFPTRTIITPINEASSQFTFAQSHKQKTKATNLRHIRDMLRRIAPVPAQVAAIVSDWDLDLDSKTIFLSGLDDSIWSLDRVSRAAMTALGLIKGTEGMTSSHLDKALEVIESSDSAKVEWVANEKQQREKATKPHGTISELDSKGRMRKLRKTCNEHEKKLLNGVVDPENIRTTFADVQASPQTIDALKTLTSLSLVRPDAFTYGVLATDRIPGLLLYGPPGTGKTLLAKAVAKESGATVLEVSGSDVYDMYVGEGEKNVRAIFTLAKKLTPCIVFIDEADAILGARSSGGSRTSHRELINQFLREWDGMTELSAFIMVATNRPFDLDEASLRRLPRRLLIDLPVEKDREAILKIHLKDEQLDPSVSLGDLAAQTPFYSGSDLKNLSVAAALACVREEFDTAASHAKDSQNSEKYTYAEKRTLYPRHFSRAMEEISASISEDMGSLNAIRKFDEKYGDRRGRRKKGGFGYRTGIEGEREGSDAARVRNQS